MAAEREVLIVDDAARAAEALAGIVATELANAAAARGVASLALAGGKTPKAAYELLATPAFRARVPWKNVHWFFGDERAVPPEHADSNYRMAREAMLGALAPAPGRVHRMEGDAPDLDAAAEKYQAEIVLALGGAVPRFDLVLLGMGADGHTASLFPGSPALGESKRLITSGPGPSGSRRITFTFPLIQAARMIVFTAAGAEKAPALKAVFEGGPGAPPAARAVPDDGRLLWILERSLADAAGIRSLPAASRAPGPRAGPRGTEGGNSG